MKIRKIKLENHPILGNLSLDFTDKNGDIINTIILAGENGVGKSVLLDIFFQFTHEVKNPNTYQRNEKRHFEIELSEIERKEISNFTEDKGVSLQKVFTVTIDYNFINDWRRVVINGKSITGFNVSVQGHAFNSISTPLKALYSDVAINFTPPNIQTTTTKDIDRFSQNSVKSDNNLSSEITQLLIDIHSLDALDLSDWVDKNNGLAPPEEIKNKRIKRFTSAFEFMFPTKKFKGIENFSTTKRIAFEENDRKIYLENLSSGEKQIVYRGGFLLKDKEASRGSLILYDEPEISLHPNWQFKIMDFLKRIFTDENGHQTSQIFAATHSPFIIHNTSRINDRVIVLKKNNQGDISIENEPVFYSWTPEKIVQEAFNVSGLLSTNKAIVFVAGETDEKYFNKAMQVFNKGKDMIEFHWIGRINENGKIENTGDSALNQAKNFFFSNSRAFHDKKIILLYDNDARKPEEEAKNIYVKSLTQNNTNITFKKGIENLLNLWDGFNIHSFTKKSFTEDDYSVKSEKNSLDKVKLCSTVCETLQGEVQKQVLKNFEAELERLLKIL